MMTYRTRYFIYGAIFGFCFPVFASIFDVIMQGLPLGMDSIIQVQRTQPLHWVINSAPLFLGVFAMFAGIQQDKVLRRTDLLAKENTERKRAEVRSKALFDNSPDAFILLDSDGNIIEWNDNAVAIFGYGKSEVLGKNFSIILPPQELGLNAGYRKCYQKSENILGVIRELVGQRKDGSYFPLELRTAKMVIDKGSIFLVSARDITERKRAQNEILRLNASLEERVQQRTQELVDKVEQLALTSKYKSEFLSNMSHELRTPLNSVIVLSELLASNDDGNMSEEQIKFLNIINGSGKDLLELINDILDLAKIESGKVTTDLQDVFFTDITQHIEWNFRYMMESRGLGFSITLAPDLPPSLYTDSQRLQQVMRNLLSNALKFTEQGQVSVRIAAEESVLLMDHDGHGNVKPMIAFYVTDTGIGLADDKQKIIFESFQQADTGTAKKYGGTGLGLSISRELAWLLGGALQLEMSSPGKGSTFVLYLPAASPELGQNSSPATQAIMPLPETSQEPILNSAMGSRTSSQHAGGTPALPSGADLASTTSPASLAGKKVLLVDDDPHNIIALTALLLRHKMVVTSAENGRAALEQLGSNPDVDIVLMDIMMPEMGGYEAMRQIRQMKQFESLPIIALTAKAMNGDREKCIAAGASDYVSKPVDADKLCSIMRALLCR